MNSKLWQLQIRQWLQDLLCVLIWWGRKTVCGTESSMKPVSEGGTGTVEPMLHTHLGGVTADWERASVWDRRRGGVCAPTSPFPLMGAWHNRGEGSRSTSLLFPVIFDSPVLTLLHFWVICQSNLLGWFWVSEQCMYSTLGLWKRAGRANRLVNYYSQSMTGQGKVAYSEEPALLPRPQGFLNLSIPLGGFTIQSFNFSENCMFFKMS